MPRSDKMEDNAKFIHDLFTPVWSKYLNYECEISDFYGEPCIFVESGEQDSGKSFSLSICVNDDYGGEQYDKMRYRGDLRIAARTPDPIIEERESGREIDLVQWQWYPELKKMSPPIYFQTYSKAVECSTDFKLPLREIDVETAMSRIENAERLVTKMLNEFIFRIYRNQWRSIVKRDPTICHGIECFIGTRIIVNVVFGLIENGLNDERILHELPSLNPRHLELARKATEYFWGIIRQ